MDLPTKEPRCGYLDHAARYASTGYTEVAGRYLQDYVELWSYIEAVRFSDERCPMCGAETEVDEVPRALPDRLAWMVDQEALRADDAELLRRIWAFGLRTSEHGMRDRRRLLDVIAVARVVTGYGGGVANCSSRFTNRRDSVNYGCHLIQNEH